MEALGFVSLGPRKYAVTFRAVTLLFEPALVMQTCMSLSSQNS